MIQENLLKIDILKDDVNSFVEFLQAEFKCEVSVEDIFGSKFELSNPVKPEIKTPSIVSSESAGELNDDVSDEEYVPEESVLVEKEEQDLEDKHTEVKYKCEECDFKTENKKKLASHVKKEHPVKKEFQCDQCDQRFERKEGLTKHINLRHGDGNFEIYECKHCDYKSKYVKRLENHINEHHSDGSSVKSLTPKKSTMP